MYVWWPNSTGKFWDLCTSIKEEGSKMGTASGVFKTGASSDNNVYAPTTTVSIGKDDGVSLDLSRSSSLFSGTKLQAPALQVLACVRF